ncbi:MAG: peptidase M15 [Xanthobacteraceae bacterium]
MKRLRRLAVLAALYGTVALASWVAAGLAGLGSLGIEGGGAPIETVGRAKSATARAQHIDAPRATALGEHGVSVAVVVSGSDASSDPERNEAKEAAGAVKVADTGSGSAALSDPPPMPQPATPPALFAAASPTLPVQNAARPAVSSEVLDACPEPDVCIDQYLWSLYERTPKVDTIKVDELIKVKVKNKKGKTRTVVKTQTKYITEDFGWKDPKAAQKAGMSLKDYVIGGMDRDFRGKLYKALHAMDDAGLSPGITSGFRDDYRQELASGDKAASDSSYHGGSRRGGYGHGLAADVVSVKGDTRAERCAWSETLWKWIDAHENELGIGRPYLNKDPPHVGPIDGKEYVDKRSAAKAQLAGLKKPSPSSRPK